MLAFVILFPFTVREIFNNSDIYFKNILKSKSFRVTCAADPSPSGNTQGNLLKNLPPRKDDEFWMVYVSASKREIS